MIWTYITDWRHMTDVRPEDPAILPKLDKQLGQKPHALGEIDQCFIIEGTAERFGSQWIARDSVPHKIYRYEPFFHSYDVMDLYDTPEEFVRPAQRVWATRMPKFDGSEDIYQADYPITDAEIFRIKLDTTNQEVIDSMTRGPMIGSYPRHLYKDLSKFEIKAFDADSDLDFSPTNTFIQSAGGQWQLLDQQFFDDVQTDTDVMYKWMRTGSYMDVYGVADDSYLDKQKTMNGSFRNLFWTYPIAVPKMRGSPVAQLSFDVQISQICPKDPRALNQFTRYGYARKYIECAYDSDQQRFGFSGNVQISRAQCVDVVRKIFPDWEQLFVGEGVKPPDGYYRMCKVSAGYVRVFVDLDLETTLRGYYT